MSSVFCASVCLTDTCPKDSEIIKAVPTITGHEKAHQESTVDHLGSEWTAVDHKEELLGFR